MSYENTDKTKGVSQYSPKAPSTQAYSVYKRKWEMASMADTAPGDKVHGAGWTNADRSVEWFCWQSNDTVSPYMVLVYLVNSQLWYVFGN